MIGGSQGVAMHLSVLGDFYHVDMQLLGDSGWLPLISII